MSEIEGANESESEYLREFVRELPVALDESELQAYGKMLAEKCKEEEHVEDKKKQVVKEYAAALSAIRNEVRRLAEARAKGSELRNVKCAEKLDGERALVQIIRLDTNEVVSVRAADMRDMQTTIPGTSSVIPGTTHSEIDDGPRGDDLGDGAGGKLIEGQFGDRIYAGAPDDRSDDAPPHIEKGENVDYEPPSAPDVDDDGPPPDTREMVGGLTPHEQRARDIAQRDQEIATEPTRNAKPKRERSAKKNSDKPKRKR